MAKTWTNTVPDGRIGTGNAQVFGVNPLAGQFANQLGALREQQQLKAQQVAKDWRDFDIAASEGLLWAPEISNIEKTILDKGIKLKQAGVDPYGSSEDAMQFRRDLAGVKSLQGYRKSAEEQAKETSKYIRQNLDTLDPEDVQKYHDFYKNTSLEDAYGKNLMPPEIRKRFNDEDVLKNLKARTIKEDITLPTGERTADTVLDMKGTENVVLGAYLGNPRGRDQLLKVTAGLPPRDVQEFAPTYEGNVMQVQSYLEGTPGALEDLAANGILPGTPQMKEYVSDLAAKRASVRKNFDNWLLPKVDRLASGEDIDRVRVAAKEDKMSAAQKDASARGWANIRLRERQIAEGGQPSNENAEIPRDLNLAYKNGTANVNVKDYVGVSIPTKSLVGLPTYNLSTGSLNQRLNPSVDAKVVGVGNFPIMNQKAGKQYAGQVAQPKLARERPQAVTDQAMLHIKEPVAGNPGFYEDILIPYDALPANIKNSKAVKEALANFRPAGVSDSPVAESNVPKKVEDLRNKYKY